MNNNLRKILTVMVFIFFFAIVGLSVNEVIRKKWDYESNNAAQQIVQGYYMEKEQSLDVLILGASTMRNGMSPLYMFDKYGFTSYSRATSVQPVFISYYLLKETLEQHDIKAVVLDASGMFTLTNNMSDMDGKMHEAVDYMKFSRYKLEIISALSEMGYNSLDFFLPLYKYHERWTELSEDDFMFRQWVHEYFYKGQYPNIHIDKFTFSDKYMSAEFHEDSFLTFDGDSMVYYDKIVDLCRDNGIELILVKTPISGWSIKRNEMVQQYADVNRITFIDFNLENLREDIYFNESMDFSDDGKHVNLSGANKMSDYIGKVITDLCILEDKRGNGDYVSWNDDVNMYKRIMLDMEISNEVSVGDLFNKVKGNGYTVVLAARDESLEQFDAIASDLSILGLSGNTTGQNYVGYIAVVGDEGVLYEDARYGSSVSFNGVVGDYKLSILSNADRVSGNTASIVINGHESSLQKEGINIVVIDNVLGKIIAKRALNAGFSDIG